MRGNPVILDTVAGSNLTRNLDNQGLAELTWSTTTPDGDQVTLKGFAGDYRFVGRYALDESPATVNEDSDVAHWWGAEGRVTTLRLDGHQLTAGAEFQSSPKLYLYNADVAPASAPYLDQNNGSHRAAAFAEDVWQLSDHLRLDSSLRIDATSAAPAQASGRLALIWKADEALVGKAIFGTAYRPPNAFEAHYQVAGPGGYEANAGLRSEAVRGAELNVEWHPDASDSFSGSVYRNVARKLIVQVRDEDADSYTFINQGSVTAQGAEIEWQHAWATGQRVRANLSYALASDHDTGLPIAIYAPRYLANVTGISHVTSDVQAGIQWRAVSRRGGASAYTLFNFSLSSSLRPHGWSWSASVQNLFNRNYADPGTDLVAQPRIQQAHRSLELTLARAF